MAQIWVGTSGWQYDDWRGDVYPQDLPKSRWFSAYAQWFPTVEINASFYRLPTERAITRWREQAPPGFRYAVKGSKYVTHNLKIGGERLPESVALGVNRTAELRSTLAVVLWQLPPNLHRDDARLDRFLGLLPKSMRHAVEFRHKSWWADGVCEVLRKHGAAFTWVSGLKMPDDRAVTADFTYLRFHGKGEHAYRYDYQPHELEPWAEALRDVGLEGFAYFNNDYHGNAIHNARTFTELLGDIAVSWG